MIVPKNYFPCQDVVFLAKDLVGKSLFSKIDGQFCGGIITETEVVTNKNGVPDAVLIRAIRATHGEELMLKRTGDFRMTPKATNTPEKVNKALGNSEFNNDELLLSKQIWIDE